jgi:lipopolysaccharide export system protein LptA
MTGAVILYNNTTDVFTIDGAVAKGSPGAPAGRVRAMLTPKPDAAASNPASATTSPGLTPALRATTTLGGEKK